MTNLKLRPIIDQTGTCYYKTGKVISKYLRPLTKNEFVISNTQDVSTMLNNVPISEDEEDVSYDVESLFTNIPLNDTQILFVRKYAYTRNYNQFAKNLYSRNFFTNSQRNLHLVLQENFGNK